MKNKKLIDSASGALGYSAATFGIVVNLLVTLARNGAIRDQDSVEIIRRASLLVEHGGAFLGDPDAQDLAKDCLRLALELFQTATAQKPPGAQN